MIRTVRRWAGAVALGAFALVAVGRLVGDLHLGGALGLCVTARRCCSSGSAAITRTE